VKNGKGAVHRISGARKGLTEDVAGRQRRYVVSMSIRTVCFVTAVFAPSPWRWILVAGALFLPYIAVVLANAGREPTSNTPVQAQIVPPLPPKMIEPPAGAVLTSAERRTVHAHAEDSWTVPTSRAAGDDDAPANGFDGGRRTGFRGGFAEGSSTTPGEATDRTSHTNSDTHGDTRDAGRGPFPDPEDAPSRPAEK